MSNINSGINGTCSSSNNGNFIAKAWSYVSSRVRRRFNRAQYVSHPDLEAEGVQSGVDESNGNDDSREIVLLEILRETPPIAMADQTGAGNSITNGLVNTNDALLNLQKTGLKVVKYLVMPTSLVVAPTVIATSVNLFQVFTANSTVAASTKTFLLKPTFTSAIVNVGLGAILFMLSTSDGNFRGKVFVLKVTINLTYVSTAVEIALLFAAGWQFISLV